MARRLFLAYAWLCIYIYAKERKKNIYICKKIYIFLFLVNNSSFIISISSLVKLDLNFFLFFVFVFVLLFSFFPFFFSVFSSFFSFFSFPFYDGVYTHRSSKICTIFFHRLTCITALPPFAPPLPANREGCSFFSGDREREKKKGF